MHCGGGKAAAEVVIFSVKVTHGKDSVGDRGADVGAHNHEDDVLDGELVDTHEGDDDGGYGGDWMKTVARMPIATPEIGLSTTSNIRTKSWPPGSLKPVPIGG